MARGVNCVILIGHLGKDPKLQQTKNGSPVCNFDIATNEQRKVDGEWQDHAEWTRIVVWGSLAEECDKHLRKGSQAYVEGRLQTRQWDDDDGITRYITEVVAKQVLFLSKGSEGGGQRENEPPPPSDESIPF